MYGTHPCWSSESTGGHRCVNRQAESGVQPTNAWKDFSEQSCVLQRETRQSSGAPGLQRRALVSDLCPKLLAQGQDRIGTEDAWAGLGFLVPEMEFLLCSLHCPEGLKGEEIKKCGREGIPLNKYNQQYHKLFKDVPLEEVVLKVCSCALQRDLLLQGRLYISPNWLCFHASLFGKDIKVVIPVVSVQMIKKHKLARLLPNGLAITTNTRQKYIFVSLLSRDSVYELLRRVCTHLQPSSKKSLTVREFPEEPESLEVLIPEMKWRKVCPSSKSLSLPDNMPRTPPASVDSTDGFFPSRTSPGPEKSRAQVASENGGRWAWPMPGWGPACPKKMPNCSPIAENAVCEEDELEEETGSTGELRLWDHRLLKVFFVLICILVVSSSYLAFRISQLEQQLCSLSWDSPVPGHR
ncbi:GRAM domain-containing protein 2A isoform X1 [Sapajus apella]|uniref:GRAM domain-containing protein 2A isoform X1 n=1 Tax=Sapajus apella TaxID=9515 RepID=A0A6J3F4P4_SAPAP|nr:GRAM domain-containing protein 2A isoform X1 [Sapajus apella]XP_032100584.1 GRAM domain-containing protein 2A isoform X1 [Sapajus apella]